ncbi:MAG: AMP-dependent synthetase [Anaerolineales bacterium]|nr:AMP-dependent synthetase [Anaerolineales bacterium]
MEPAENRPSSIPDLIRTQALLTPTAIAIGGPERIPLNFGGLWEQVETQVQALKALGLEGTDRIALALPNGPEMAVAFLAVASCATCAPLNPEYRAPEFEFYLTDLEAKALILAAGAQSAAREVADSLGIPTIELVATEGSPAGVFAVHGKPRQADAGGGLSNADDIALVLHTSGTTSRPKMVPLTHANLCVSAENVRASLALVPDDRCLNVMPLFHIHGLPIPHSRPGGCGPGHPCRRSKRCLCPGFLRATFL